MSDASTQRQIWTGTWCWTGAHPTRPWNAYAYFRKTVRLQSEPQRCTVRVSADARYTLYLNGRRVHQGPARSMPEYQSYDVLDLTPYLEVGDNSVCAIVHQFGVPTFFSQYRAASGFLLDGVIELEGERLPLHTPGGWTCRDARGWRQEVARLSMQMGFQEHFDADADPADWLSPSYEARAEDGWTEPHVVGPAGCHPWLYMEPRGVPLLVDSVESLTAVTAQFKGDNGRGYKITPDVYNFLHAEPRKKERNLLEHAQAMLLDDADVTVVAPATDSEFIMAVLDLGTYRTGHVILDVAEASGDEIIDVIVTESIDKAGAPQLRGGDEPDRSQQATGLRYRCRPGKQCWESFQPLGGRYVTLVFRNIDEKPLKVRYVAMRHVHAALGAPEELGAFECSDKRLNEIWRVSRHTQLNCMLDAFVDCPGREQAQWWGDARIQSLVTAYAFGDLSLLERGIRQVARSQASDGSLHAHPPSDCPGHRLPDFMMTWVGSLWDHYRHTGDASLVRECLPVMHRLFAFLKSHVGATGLIGGFDGFWVFLDWSDVRKADFSATLNLLYLQALRNAAALCRVASDSIADPYRKTAEALEGAIEKHFWDEATKTWRDGYDPQAGAMTDEVSQHANALAILLDLKPESHARIAREVLLKPAQSRRTKVVTASPFFYAYVLDAIVKTGARREAVDLIRAKWGEWLDAGATTFWEYWEPIGSLCHAWSASPLYLLSQQLLGVTPTEPGWRRVRIAPLTEHFDFARGVVPSPHGAIRVDWEKSDDQLAVRIDLPEGVHGDFVEPGGKSRSLEPGPHEFHT